VKSYFKKQDKLKDLKEKLDRYKTMVDVRYLLDSLGFKILKETPREIRGMCKIHGGDNTTAFRFNKETRTWVCFTHRCHELHGNDIIGLIKASTNRDFIGAVDWLKALVGEDVDADKYIAHKRDREMKDFVNSYSLGKTPKSVNERSLIAHKEFRSGFFLKEGFKPETLDHFEIAGGWKDPEQLTRDIIPIRDDRGKLVAFSLRDIREDVDEIDEDKKYIHTPGFNKDGTLYNLNNAWPHCENKPLILVEGFKSVWRLHEYGIKNVVAVMGSSLTDGQKFLLYQYDIKSVVVFFDNDQAGVIGTQKVMDDLKNKLEVIPVFIQEVDENGKGLDPADLSKELVYEYLNTYY
jgi:DNA primase